MIIQVLGQKLTITGWVLAYNAVLVAQQLLEIRMVRGLAQGETGKRTGAGTLSVFVAAFAVAAAGTGASLLFSDPDPFLFAAGLVGFCLLHFLRGWIVRSHLKEAWNPFTTPRSGSELATRGPYRFVRHPLYAVHILQMGALWLVMPNPFALAGWVADILATLWRIPGEERLLEDSHGEAWRTYAKRSWRLLPGIW